MPNVSSVIDSLLSQANPSAIRFLRFNADNTASLLADSVMRTALGLGSLATLSDGSTITALNASNLASGTVSIARLVNTQTVGNADATIAATTRDVILNVVLTLPRTFTWPLANAYPAGARVSFTDMANTLTAANTATLARSGGDLINNSTSLVLNTSGASPILISDGISRWNVDIRGVSRGGTGAITAAGARLNLGLGTTDSPVFAGLTAIATLNGATVLSIGSTNAGYTATFQTHAYQQQIVCSNGMRLPHVESNSFRVGEALDLFLQRDAANTLAQRNLSAPQSFRLYNTTDAGTVNCERGTFGWTTNVLRIGTEQLGTGVARAIDFVTGGTARWGISTAGHMLATVDNIYDIGANGANRPRNVFVAGTAVFGSTGFFGGQVGSTADFYIASRSYLSSPTDGLWTMWNAAKTDFNRLQFGGTTNLFPALKRSTTSLQARLADDTAFTNIQGKLTTEIAYVAAAHTATGYLTIYDSTGTAYKVAASL